MPTPKQTIAEPREDTRWVERFGSDTLLTQRKQHLAAAKAILGKADAERREPTDQEAADFDAAILAANKCLREFERTPPPRQQTRLPDLSGEYGATYQRSRPRFATGAGLYDRLFGTSRDTGGFQTAGEFMEVLASGRFDQRLQAANRIGVDSEGGFAVPEAFISGIFDAAIEASVLLSRVRTFRMTSDTLKIASFDGQDHTSSLFGGFEGGWESELADASPQTAKLRQIIYTAKKLLILQRTSNELLQDGADFERLLYEALGTAMAFKLDEAILRGTGAGQPLGILNAGSTITASAVAGQTADTIWWKNIIDMMARLSPGCWGNAIWLTHPSCVASLFRLDAHADLAGSGSLVGDTIQPVFREASGTFSLLGRPCLVTEKCSKLGDVGDIVLCDPSQYGLGLRQGLVIEKSAHYGFASDSSHYRAKLRCDGSPLWSEPVTPRNDTATLSWAVVLEAR